MPSNLLCSIFPVMFNEVSIEHTSRVTGFTLIQYMPAHQLPAIPGALRHESTTAPRPQERQVKMSTKLISNKSMHRDVN